MNLKKIIAFVLFFLISCNLLVFAAPYADELTVNINMISGQPKLAIASANLNTPPLAPGDTVATNITVNNNTDKAINWQYIGNTINDSSYTVTIIQNGQTIFDSSMANTPISLIKPRQTLNYEIAITFDINATNEQMNESTNVIFSFSATENPTWQETSPSPAPTPKINTPFPNLSRLLQPKKQTLTPPGIWETTKQTSIFISWGYYVNPQPHSYLLRQLPPELSAH